MEMGDQELFTNQVGRICVRIGIRGLFLWVEYEPCIIYEKRGSRSGSPTFLCGGFSKEWRWEILYEEIKNNGENVWRLWDLCCFLFLWPYFPFEMLIFYFIKYYSSHISLFDLFLLHYKLALLRVVGYKIVRTIYRSFGGR